MRFFLVYLFTLVSSQSMEDTSLLFCVPHVLETISRETLENRVKSCFRENYIHLVHNETQLNIYIDGYMSALVAKKTSSDRENELFLSKHEMILTLRNYQIETSRHIHTIEACTAISHKMPSTIVDAYTNEAAMMFEVSELWMHHITADLNRCHNLLITIIIRSHRRTAQHLQYLFIKYRTLLTASNDAYEQENKLYGTMLQERGIFIKTL